MLSRMLLKMWLLPPLCNILLVLLGLVLLRRFKRIGVSSIVAGVLSLWLFATPQVANLALRLIEKSPAITLEQIQGLEKTAIVVLGSGHTEWMPEYGYPQPDHNAVARITYGTYLKRRSGLPLMTTGGVPLYAQNSHARIMARYMETHLGVSPDWVEEKSRTTWENAKYAAEILFEYDIRRVVLVTQSVHMRRSELLFKAAGFEVIPAPTELSVRANSYVMWLPTSEALHRTKMVIHEILGLAWYMVNPPER